MIRVNRSGVPVPAVLNGPGSEGMQERQKATAFYANPANREKSFDFRVYKDDAVKRALNELFHLKCAYCESKYAATQPVDVEHYRPKGAVVVNGERRKPGYYWLAAAWDNLLPSCIDCNRSRTQEFPDADPRLSGKANLFPVENEDQRATAPGEEAQERRLLLHPCRDFPEAHLEFLEEGLVRPKLKSGGQPSPKGVASIEVYGLQRMGLVSMRRDRLKLVLAQIKRVARLVERLDRDPDDVELQGWLEEEMAELQRLQQADQPYAAMAQQFIAAFIETVQ